MHKMMPPNKLLFEICSMIQYERANNGTSNTSLIEKTKSGDQSGNI